MGRHHAWLAALDVRCPTCGSPRLELCRFGGRTRTREDVHHRRVADAERVASEVAELSASLDRARTIASETLAAVGGAS